MTRADRDAVLELAPAAAPDLHPHRSRRTDHTVRSRGRQRPGRPATATTRRRPRRHSRPDRQEAGGLRRGGRADRRAGGAHLRILPTGTSCFSGRGTAGRPAGGLRRTALRAVGILGRLGVHAGGRAVASAAAATRAGRGASAFARAARPRASGRAPSRPRLPQRRLGLRYRACAVQSVNAGERACYPSCRPSTCPCFPARRRCGICARRYAAYCLRHSSCRKVFRQLRTDDADRAVIHVRIDDISSDCTPPDWTMLA